MFTSLVTGLASLALLVGCSDGGTTARSTGSSGQLVAPSPDKVVTPGVPPMKDLYTGAFSRPPTTSFGSLKALKGKSVWWVTCSSGTPACLIPGQAAKEAGRALGIDVTIADGKYNIGGAQSTAIRSAIAAHADGIILYGMNCSNVQQALEEAKSAHVLVMGAASPDCSANGGPALYTAPMLYNEKIKDSMAWYRAMGALSADYIINRSNGQAKIIYNFNTAESQLRAADEGFRAQWAKCKTCKMVDQIKYAITDHVQNGPWIQAFRSSLIKHPDANAIFLDWDVEMSVLGGVQAVREAGMTNTLIFGGEGVQETFDFVHQGRVTALTKVTARQWFGYAAMDNMARALNGRPAVPEGLGLVVTDKDHNLPAAGQLFAGPPGIDFKALYRKSWGAPAGG
ncbi:substrate-binding domain-containing protein [Streptomyces carpinensis]|uniref:Substrate-binding domain-containing protein n=2 Tax=Streptomyces carpinensis TaxID=66369 RepID=A0ABV1VUQ5_9ACTN